MPEPIEYRAILALRDALKGMTVAAGYFYTVETAMVKLDPNQDVEAVIPPDALRPLVLLQVFPERWTYEHAEQLALTLPATIHWIHDSDPLVDTDRLQTFFRGCADVEKAVAANIELGALARDVRIVERTMRDLDGSEVWAMLRADIAIHREYGRPNG